MEQTNFNNGASSWKWWIYLFPLSFWQSWCGVNNVNFIAPQIFLINYIYVCEGKNMRFSFGHICFKIILRNIIFFLLKPDIIYLDYQVIILFINLDLQYSSKPKKLKFKIKFECVRLNFTQWRPSPTNKSVF